MGWETPNTLLATIFLLSASWSLAAPAWLAITPLLVPRRDLDGATAANSVGYNISRAVGPAVAGLVIAWLGIAAPYWMFAAAEHGDDRRPDLVALAAKPRREPAGGALDQRGAHGAASRRLTTNYLRATMVRTVAVYPVRQRLYGAVAVHGPQPDGARGRGSMAFCSA